MTNNEKAFKEAEKELQKEKISEIKNMMKSLLQKIQDEKEKKTEAEESLRILKLDMDDLRKGKIEKIKERHDKSKKAREISPLKEPQLQDLSHYLQNTNYISLSSNPYLSKINSNTGTVANGSTMTLSSGTAIATGFTQLQSIDFQDVTAGVYNIQTANGQIKEFNL